MLSKKMMVSTFTANTTIKVLCTKKYTTLAINAHYDITLSNPKCFLYGIFSRSDSMHNDLVMVKTLT